MGLFAAALTVKLIVLAQLHDHPLLQPTGGLDGEAYATLARRAAAGDWTLGPDAYYVAPLYVYFLALVFVFPSASLLAAQVVQACLGAGAVVLVAATARQLFGAGAFVPAGVLAALTGVFTFNEVLILQSALDPFLVALSLHQFARALGLGGEDARSGSPAVTPLSDFALAGLAAGLLSLNRPNALAWALLAGPLVALLRLDRGAGRAAARGGVFALGLALAVVPATLRNRLVAGEWILISSHGGLNLAIGNNPRADGTYVALPGITPSIEGQARDAEALAENAVGRPLGASEVSAYFTRQALDWIGSEPARAARLFARKLMAVFNQVDLSLNYSYAYYSRDERTLLSTLAVGPWLLVPLGALGLAAGIARTEAAQLRAFLAWVAFVPVYALTLAVFFVSSRYRLPVLVPLAALGGAGAAWLFERGWTTSGPRPVVGLGAAATGAVLALWPLGYDDGRSNERTERIVQLMDAGEIDRARELLARTEPSHPERPLLLYRVGRALHDRGRHDLAADLLSRASAAEPGRVEVRLALGQALLDGGRPAEAVPHLEAARSGERPDLAGFDLARALAELGRREEAARILRTTPARASADAESRNAFGRLALELGDAALAREHFHAAVGRAAPETTERANALAGLGLSFGMLKRPAEGVGPLQEACRITPHDSTARLNLAVLLAQLGRIAEARAQAEEALRLNPDYPQARGLLEDLRRHR